MSRELLKNMIDLIPDSDVETIYNVVIRFVREEAPLEDEIRAIEQSRTDRTVIPHEAVNWL